MLFIPYLITLEDEKMESKLGFYNTHDVVLKEFRICDSTLRDGEQTAGVSFSIEDRKAIATLLDKIGTHQIQL